MSRIAFAPFALLVATACGGGDLCQKWADDLEACADDDASVDQCEEQIASCDSQDRKLLDDFYECGKDAGMFECDPETATTTNLTDAFGDLGAILACAEPLEGLSEECQGGMMTSSTSSVF